MISTPSAAGRFVVFLAIVASGLFGAGCQAEPTPVRTWVEDVVIPTYPLRADDINPHFFELGGSIIYPYTMQDGFSRRKVDRTYRAVFVENEYLRVMVLPEIGGRIQSVYDKAHDEEMFYRNHVIRPGHIALRGAWVSGGVEWNRGPQGHTVTSFSPVDVVAVENTDGSATLVIGNTEMNFRTGWTVRLTLHPGRAYLDEQIEIFNPTDGVHPYYFWNNTAFPNRPGTRFMYPMTLGSDHDGVNFFSWPLHEGRDMTWLKNYPGPTSVFGYQVDFDFFGAYDVDRDYGIVQYADHTDLPGKKAWTWGQSDAGLAAQSVLTDDDGPYIEVQSGPLQTQADFEMLRPGQRVAWQEFWFPAAGLGNGFEFATLDAVVQRRGNEFRLMTTRSLADATFTLRGADATTYSSRADLEAGVAVTHVASVADDEPVEVQLADADGTVLLEYRSPLDIPDRQAPDLTASSGGADLDDLYMRSFELDKQTDRLGARSGYESVLRADPDYQPAHVALGVLDAEAGLYEAALAHLDRGVELDPGDGIARYQRAAVKFRLGDFGGAAEDAALAAAMIPTASVGHDLIGKIRMRRGDTTAALTAFQEARRGGDAATRVAEHIMLATYAGGDIEAASTLANQALATGTVRLVPHAVAALAVDGSTLSQGAARFAAATTDWVGEPEFAYLELAFRLAELSLVDEAGALLRATSIEASESSPPLPLYTLAWLVEAAGDSEQARQLRRQAAQLPTDYVFPSRPEMIDVLEGALAQDGDDAHAHLYLGNLYGGLGRIDEAVDEWTVAAQLNPSLSVAHRNLGLVAWRHDNDLPTAVSRYQAAIDARPDDQTLYRDLAGVLVAQGQADRAIWLLENIPGDAERRADATVLLARTYAAERRYDEAIALLESTTFTNREGDAGTWQVFTRAHIDRGIARLESGDSEAALADFEASLTYPANLNAGRPHEPQEARAQYWRGMALQALDRLDEARAAWQACVDGVAAGTEQEEHIALCRTRLLRLR